MHWDSAEVMEAVGVTRVSALLGPLLARSIGLAAGIGLALLGAALFWG